MASGPDVYEKLTHLLEDAAGKAFEELFSKFPEEKFYYCTLVTSGEALCPMLSAWSYEALERESANGDDPPEDREILKWSYADSPFCDFGAEYFAEVEQLFNQIVMPLEAISESQWDIDVGRRMESITNALINIDNKGLFGTGARREKLLLVAEMMPPDDGNATRAKLMNDDTEILREYLAEAF